MSYQATLEVLKENLTQKKKAQHFTLAVSANLQAPFKI